ncbi:MAG: serine hydrolase, partial [Planctomycetes bacterium]|nr:serine hydrolase [Planctomycetota bacterium]
SAGWSSEKLLEAETYAGSIDTAAVVVVHGGRIVWEWGETSRPFMCHSMRKSILSLLYGNHVADGRIDLGWTLERLGIDDREESLTEIEKRATVEMLLQARSGIYHPALYEAPGMKARRPARGSHAPGTFWYYNNWDFNALGTIFENLTGRSIFEEFEERLARPLGMQDFDREKHTEYVTGPDSVHPAYPFQLSARDLARLGLLCARGGRWRDEQIVPRLWMVLSTRSFSDAGEAGGYGYMWWIAAGGKHVPGAALPDGSYSARGYRGHYVLVVPQWDLVIVHRVDTFAPSHRVTHEQFGELLRRILEARPEEIRPKTARI